VATLLTHAGPGLWDYLRTNYAYQRDDSRDDER
jgi:hypothetical protein